MRWIEKLEKLRDKRFIIATVIVALWLETAYFCKTSPTTTIAVQICASILLLICLGYIAKVMLFEENFYLVFNNFVKWFFIFLSVLVFSIAISLAIASFSATDMLQLLMKIPPSGIKRV